MGVLFVLVVRLCLVGGGIGGYEFDQAKDGSVVASLAFDFVDSFPSGFFLVGSFGAREVYFYLEAIQGAAEGDTARDAGRVALKAVFAGGDDRGLELQDCFIAKAGGVGEIARSTTNGGDQAFIRVHQQRNLMRQGRHG